MQARAAILPCVSQLRQAMRLYCVVARLTAGRVSIRPTQAYPSIHPLFHNTIHCPGASLRVQNRRVTLRAASTNSSTAHATVPAGSDPRKDPPPSLVKIKSHFCRQCGSSLELRIPAGEKEHRHVCSNAACGYIDYFNPKIVVGCIVEHQGKILLCKRAIEPCRGKWTVPAGYMELNESSADGAARETWEEASASVTVVAPYAHWDIPAIGQAYILFRAHLAPPFTFAAGPESLETQLFAPQDIPFDQLAFSSVAVSLRYYLDDLKNGQFRVHHGVIDKRPGSSPNDPATFEVKQHMAMQIG